MKTQLVDQYGQPIATAKQRLMVDVHDAAVKRIKARFDAAETTSENSKHWSYADSLSADAALTPEIRCKLRDRARYEFANNTYCNGMVRTLANDIIGTGPKLQVQSGDKFDDTAVEWAWYYWTRATNFPAKLRLLRTAKARDGEGFARFVNNPRIKTRVKLDLQLYEAEQIATPWQEYDVASITDGVILDDFGNVAGYTVLWRHPGDQYYMEYATEYDTVPARDMMHLLHTDRAGQHRGIPEIAPALPLFAQLRRYVLAVLAAAETAADFAAVMYTDSPSLASEDIPNLSVDDPLEIRRRMFQILPNGWKMMQLKAEQPATSFAEFKAAIIGEIARCLNMPFNIAAGNSSGYNYASGRLDHQTYFKSIHVDRSQLEWDVVEPTFDRWWEEARLIPGQVPEQLRKLPEPPPHGWAWDGNEHVDPVKEATAATIRLESHTTTLADEYARQGQDWEEKLQQRAKEMSLIKELGLAPAAFPQQQPTNSRPEQEEDEDDE